MEHLNDLKFIFMDYKASLTLSGCLEAVRLFKPLDFGDQFGVRQDFLVRVHPFDGILKGEL